MRKETVNTFTEGLVKDLHPLNTPANVLTDALNATLVTYDGNEFILQNDVGNGRVETARLPSGYIPVGVTEYGGIIYVASYNPLTGKSQLGSFPSPERQISTEELGRKFGISTNINTDNAYIRLDILDEDKKSLYKLNPGDKFIIASDGISKYLNGSYDGILEIHVGIVDKENNLTYIEDDLRDPYIIDTNNVETNTNWQVFTSKTSGYLTIVIELKSIDTFSVSRDISVLNIESMDNKNNVNPEFALQFNGAYTTSSKINVDQFKLDCNLSSNPIYSTTGLVVGLADLRKSDILNYTITPICRYGELSSFAVSGMIDFSMLGTGFINLTEWRYYADNDYLKVNWGLDYDPIKYVKVSKVTFSFYDISKGCTPVQFTLNSSDGSVTTTNQYICGSKDNYNGNFSEKIPFINKTTVHGLTKNNLYFVVIQMDFVNKSGGDIDSMNFFRMVYTTGIFNQDFVEYRTKDFKDLNVNVHLTTSLTESIDQVTTTPQSSSLVSSLISYDNPFVALSSVYSVEGKLNVDYGLVEEDYFGEFMGAISLGNNESQEDLDDYGVVIKINDDFTKSEIRDTPSYLGTDLGLSGELESKMKEKYSDDENPRGTLELDKVTFTKVGEKEVEFSLGGEVRRGLYVTATKEETIEGECYILKPAVSDASDLSNYYFGCDILGVTPNSMSGSDTNHLQMYGNVVGITADARCYVINTSDRDTPSSLVRANFHNHRDDLIRITGDKGANLNMTFEMSSINSNTPSGVNHPIMVMIPDPKDEKGGIRLKDRSRNSSYPSKYKDNEFIDDYMAIAWKESTNSWKFINLWGIVAWNSTGDEGDPLPAGAKWNVDGCQSEFPRTVSASGCISCKLTVPDIIFNLLNRLYIAQWSSNSSSVQSLDYNSIVYHGTFDTNFKATGPYQLIVDDSKLFSFSVDSNLYHLNYEDISSLITNRLNYQETDFKEFIENNVTVKSNFSNTPMQELEYTIAYSVGKTLNMYEGYSKLVSIIVNKEVFKEDSVYIEGGKTTSDGNGDPISLNKIYMKDSSGKFIPYNGKLEFPSRATTNTTSDFFKIFRPADKLQKPIILINGTKTTSRLVMEEGNDETLISADLNVLYSGSNVW